MGAIRDAISALSSLLPEIERPIRRVSFRDKVLWTAAVLVIYFVMAEVPLYGVAAAGRDPFLYMRVIFASARGTLMELGIGPIVTAGLIMQILVGADLLKIDMKKPEDRAFFTSATKLATILVAAFEITAYAATGQFGRNLSIYSITIIYIQLLVATLIVMLLDELVSKGWGIGSGISIFIAAGVAHRIFWDLFNPLAVRTNGTVEPYGLIPFAITALSSANYTALSLFLRPHGLPSVAGLIATVATILALVYLESIRIEIPISFARYRGFSSVYPLKLLYVSSIPVILAYALFSNLTLVSHLIWATYNSDNSNPLLNLLGTYTRENGALVPTGGLAYFITPVTGLSQAMTSPLRAIGFVLAMVAASVVFSWMWMEVGGTSPSAMARQLVDAGMQVPGFRRSPVALEKLFKRYVPAIVVLGGVVVGLVAGMSQLLEVFGSGIGLLLTVDIIANYQELILREQIEEMYPRLARLLRR